MLDRYSKHAIKDSFAFADLINNFTLEKPGHMCSYDIVSLFTNVLIEETINICTEALYNSEDTPPPPLRKESFIKLIRKVTTGVEFSFDGTMYRQVDGISMGSPWDQY